MGFCPLLSREPELIQREPSFSLAFLNSFGSYKRKQGTLKFGGPAPNTNQAHRLVFAYLKAALTHIDSPARSIRHTLANGPGGGLQVFENTPNKASRRSH